MSILLVKTIYADCIVNIIFKTFLNLCFFNINFFAFKLTIVELSKYLKSFAQLITNLLLFNHSFKKFKATRTVLDSCLEKQLSKIPEIKYLTKTYLTTFLKTFEHTKFWHFTHFLRFFFHQFFFEKLEKEILSFSF